VNFSAEIGAKRFVMNCRRTREAIAPDGAIDKPAWMLAQPVTLSRNDGGTPRHVTTLRTLWDADTLYVAFDCVDPDPTATMHTRDEPLWREGNVVEMFIDPSGQSGAFFEFQVNPLNTVFDLFGDTRRQRWQGLAAWDAPGLRTAVRLGHDRLGAVTGWQVEIALPFVAVAAAPPLPGTRWLANFFRYDRMATGDGASRDELSAWSPTFGRFDQPEHWGWLRFTE